MPADLKRYRLVDYPHLAKESFKPEKEMVRGKINSFDEFSDDERKILSTIKEKIIEVVPFAVIYVFGSRVKGNFDKDSDYDILVTNVSEYFSNKIKEIIFDERVDLKFSKYISIDNPYYIEICN